MQKLPLTLSPQHPIVPYFIAFSQLVILVLFHNNYGYFRDELYYIACSDHLAWGYVDQPPFSIALLEVIRRIFGDSLHVIRFLPALAGAGVVVLSSMMARQFGGGTFAQGLAALSALAAPVLLGHGRYFSMNAFDVLLWVSAIYAIILILNDDRPKLWLVFGLIVGVGLLNKYSIGFLCIGLVAGLLLTSHRKQLATKWFWLGALLAALIFLPHIIWEVQNGFPTLEFMRNASQTKNVNISPRDFFLGQIRDVNFFNAPIWLLGLYYFFFNRETNRYRIFGWMYFVIFIVMLLGNAKVYYLAPIYPILLAGGAVFIERVVHEHAWNRLKPVAVCMLIAGTIIVVPFTVPVLPVDTFIAYQKALGVTPRADEHNSLGALPQYYADQFGWEEMVAQVASAYKTLTPEERSQCVIYVRNYGEAGAIDFFGKKYGLPPALCAHNNYWLWGPGTRTGNIAIIFGGNGDFQENFRDLQTRYKEVQHVATTKSEYSMPFENGRQIFICKGMNTTFQLLWRDERFYM